MLRYCPPTQRLGVQLEALSAEILIAVHDLDRPHCIGFCSARGCQMRTSTLGTSAS